jgi:hypothetical protein
MLDGLTQSYSSCRLSAYEIAALLGGTVAVEQARVALLEAYLAHTERTEKVTIAELVSLTA